MRIKVRSVEWEGRLLEVFYQNLMNLGGQRAPLKKEKKKAVNRMIASIENHPDFEMTDDELQCGACGNFRLHFEAKARGKENIFIPMRRGDRKIGYDEIVEASLKAGLPKALERKFLEVGATLGYRNHALSLIAEFEPEDDGDFEFEEETDEEFLEDDAPDKEDEKKEEEDAGPGDRPDALAKPGKGSEGTPKGDEEKG